MLLAEGSQSLVRRVEADLRIEDASALLLARHQFGRQTDSCDIGEIVTEGIDDNAE